MAPKLISLTSSETDQVLAPFDATNALHSAQTFSNLHDSCRGSRISSVRVDRSVFHGNLRTSHRSPLRISGAQSRNRRYSRVATGERECFNKRPRSLSWEPVGLTLDRRVSETISFSELSHFKPFASDEPLDISRGSFGDFCAREWMNFTERRYFFQTPSVR